MRWSSRLGVFSRQLAELSEAGRRRVLLPLAGKDFASNDYLALAGSSRLHQAVGAAMARGVPVGSGGSRLLRGNHPEHEELEAEAARFFGSEAALFFSNGYAANTGLLSTLPQRGDLVVHDELVHASSHEGMRLGRADRAAFAHNDVEAAESAIRDWRTRGGGGRVWIAVESLYSMDGDQAPIQDLSRLADRCDAFLIVDEAHATGVFGPDGRGLAADLDGRENVLAVRTCGKALGCEGALVCSPKVLRDFLINRARPFIFSTAPSPLMAAAVREALRILCDEPERRDRLQRLSARASAALARHGVPSSGSQILPLVLGAEARAMAVAGRLQSQGFDVRGVRPPTVPAGTARLRICITLNADEAAIDALDQALENALSKAP